MPGKPPGPELWNPPASTSTNYRPSNPTVVVKQAIPVHQQYHAQCIGPSHIVAHPADIEASYFQSCLTPDHSSMNEEWDNTLKPEEPTMNTCQYKDFGLGLDAFDDDRTPTAASCNTAKSFAYPETSTGQELLDFGISSPDRRSLSSFSEGSSVFASEFAELSTVSEYPCLSTEFSSTYEPAPLAHEATPRFSQHKFETSRHRFVAESSPRHSYRASPYVVDRSRSRSSSTSSFVLSRTQRSSPFVHSDASDFSFQDLDFSSQGTSPSIMSSSIPNIDSNCINMPLFCSEAHFKQSSFFPPRSCQDNDCQPRASSATSSSGIFNVLHSNSQVEQQYDDCIPDLPGPPDLFGALQEDQILPPDEDMRPSDPDLMPREQELRFEGDLYTPRFVRGHGNKREGWCGICKPGRWLVLKNSGYWYDKSFTHGVSAATGMAFDGPTESRRMDRHPGVWEGLCNSCGEWIALISSKKKGTTWFRHAYKCHTHQKLKDAPKKRREAAHFRAARPAKMAKSTRSTRGSSLSSLDCKSITMKDELDAPDGLNS